MCPRNDVKSKERDLQTMKLAVTGKGGVGKTTVSAFLSRGLQKAGFKVIAIDADPDSNLAACMGYPNPETISPIVELKELIEERTGVKPGTTGGMFRLNPFVEDIPEKYAVEIDGIKVIVAGAVKKGGSGCYCPENTLIRTLITHLLTDKAVAIVLDMEAGIEHLSRGTISAVDHLLIVVEPGRRSIETAERIAKMAAEIGLCKVSVIGNKIRSESDKLFLQKTLPGMRFVGFLPYDPAVREAEIQAEHVAKSSPGMESVIAEIINQLKEESK
jgi:CO dehydrogenase maturation factor